MPHDGVAGYIAYNVPNKPRAKMRTGKFLGKKLQLNNNYLNPAMLEYLAGKVNMAIFGVENGGGMQFLVGDDITRAYEKSTGCGSCMTGSSCEKVGLYAMNPTRFKLAVLELGANSGRALLVKLDNGDFYLDRVYCDSRSIRDAMYQYAIKEGWYYRDGPEGIGLWHNESRMSDHSMLIASDLEYEDGKVPYMDTFTYGNVHNGCLDISATDGNIDLQSTNGWIEDGGIVCASCDDYANEETYHVVDDETICDDCFDRYYFHCGDCDINYRNNEEHTIDDTCCTVCTACLDNYNFCEDCETYNSETTYLETLEKDVCNHCLRCYQECEGCNEYVPNADIDVDGRCPNCPEPEEEDEPEEQYSLFPEDDEMEVQDEQQRF